MNSETRGCYHRALNLFATNIVDNGFDFLDACGAIENIFSGHVQLKEISDSLEHLCDARRRDQALASVAGKFWSNEAKRKSA